ncbi:ATP-binding cassette domain-containing protein [Streptococcus marmotae]|uniref:ATP-binding cassette domain-containing protein n=1 Tax=Streptococcus marmotae TaxID=1825069 RepID=UPI000AFF7EF1|nr:ABC transporter ATP-binding protein [Streptococcus marmotae]
MNYKYLLKYSPKYLLVFILLTMVIASFDGVILSSVISKVTEFDRNSSIQEVLGFSLSAFILYSLIMVSGQLNSFLRNKLLYIINIKIKEQYITNKLQVDDYKNDTDEIVSFMLNDFTLVESNYIGVLLDVLSFGTMGIVSMGYLIYLNPTIAVLFIIFSFLPMLPPKLMSSLIQKKSLEWSNANEEFTARLKSIFAGRKVIKTYSAYNFSNQEISSKLREVEGVNKSFKNTQNFANFISAILSWVGYIVPITGALYFVIRGQLEAGAVVAMFLASDRVIYPLRNVSMLLNQINTTKEAREKIYKILQVKTDFSGDKSVDDKVDIVLEDVHFSFGNKKIVEGISYTFEYGKKYLISGSSGTGKTTILDLLQGVFIPDSGRIVGRVGNRSVELSSSISRISQEPVLFQTSIRNNLLLGKEIDEVKVLSILSRLGLVTELGSNLLDIVCDDRIISLSGG